MSDLNEWEQFESEYLAWAVATFPEGTAASAAKHLAVEADELAESGEPVEAADCFMLLLFIAHKEGFDLLEEARKKFEINKTREWNPPNAQGFREHKR